MCIRDSLKNKALWAIVLCVNASEPPRVCRRLVQAAQENQLIVRWVKVKGHSEEEGNDAADQAANWAQNGGSKGEQDIETIMDYLRDGTQPRHPDE